jgi:hypothetical protein
LSLNLRWRWCWLGIGIRISAGNIAARIICRVVVRVTMAVARLRGSGVGWIEEIGTSRFVLVLEETHLVE